MSGLLLPGFSKRFESARADGGAERGFTYWFGLRIGAFDVVPASQFGGPDAERRCLRYRAWPVVDVLDAPPCAVTARIAGAGYIRLGSRLVRFCRFRLDAI